MILKLITKWQSALKRDTAAPGPDMSRIALRCTVVPARIVPSYPAAAMTVMPDSRWVRPAPTSATSPSTPGKTCPPPETLYRGSTISRMPVMRVLSPGSATASEISSMRESSRTKRNDFAFVDFKHLILVLETMAQANLLNRILRDLKFHDR